MTDAVHHAHCFQGEYLTTCKYGDDDCPARPMVNDKPVIEQLKPCPLCEREAGHVVGWRWERGFGIRCKNAGCACSVRAFHTVEAAIAAWNQRPEQTPTAPDGLLHALEALRSFVAVMIGRGPECVIPETIDTPLGVPVKIGKIMREAAAHLSQSPAIERHGPDNDPWFGNVAREGQSPATAPVDQVGLREADRD